MTDIQKGYAARNRANALLKLRNRNVVMAVPRPVGNPYAGQVKRNMPQEVGFVDLASQNYTLTTTGAIVLVATIPQGAGIGQRIGKRAYYKSITIRGMWSSDTGTTIADAAVLLIYDKRPTGAMPAITDILTASTPRSFMNDNNTGRFEVIRRWDTCFAGNSTTPTTGLEVQNFDHYVPMKKRPIVFESAGTGAIGDIDTGAVYLVCVGNAVNPPNGGLLSCTIRTRFTEN